MLYCTDCKQYAQQDGPNAYREGDICPNCGQSRLIERPSAGGFNLNLGDANAISGGVNLSDSHNVHNEDKSVHNISNVSNITNIAAQKTEMELLQEKKSLYLNECKRAYEDNVLEQSEIIALEEYRIKIGLDKVTADSILDSVRIMTERNARKTSLNPIAKTKLKILTDNLQKNEVKALMDQIDGLEALVNKFEHDELSRKYFLVLAALKPKKCISLKENSKVDSYWKSFWSYLAYIKVGRFTEAENVLMTLDRFADYPEDNITMLGVAGALIKGNTSEAKDYLSAVTGDYTPALLRFVDSIYLLLEPGMAKEMGANENTCAFYLVNFFNQEDPKERARKEAEAKAAEEARRKAAEKAAKEKADAEEKARKEAEAKRKREEEERKRAEEQKRREEEARRRAAEAEAKRKAEEEARRKAAEEAGRREEEERKRKEAEAKRRREEEYRKRMEEARAKAELEAKLRAEDKSTITVSKTSLTFSAEGGSETVEIKASGFWQLSTVPDNWAIVEERSNSIIIKVLKNDAEKERTDYLKIRCGYKEVRVDIKQEANEKKSYVLKITKVTNMMLAMATARSAFGWDVGTSRTKFSKLPLTLKIEDKQQALSIYNKLSNGGMEVNASSVSTSGKTINNCF